jgi:hypothetical protein
MATCSVEDCERPVLCRGWCNAHYLRWQQWGDPLRGGPLRVPLGSMEERFWVKVDKEGPVPTHRPELGPCWRWKASRTAAGYGAFGVDAAHGGGTRVAHLVAYWLLVGQVPEDLELDHLCHNGSGCGGGRTCPHRACVNPKHLEAVSHRVNLSRGEGPELLRARHAARTHCKRGHLFDEDNTYFPPGNPRSRSCRACARDRYLASRA